MIRLLPTMFMLLAGVVLTTTPAFAATIGLSIPLTGRAAPIAENMQTGAAMAIQGMKKIGRDVDLIIADDACDPTRAKAVAQELEKATIVAGTLCFDTAKALARELNFDPDPDLKKKPRPLIAFGTRSKLLDRARKHDELPLYTVAKSSTAEAEAFVKFALPKLGGKAFAIVDDGSLHGRSLSDELRLLGEQAGFKAKSVVNFRPLQTTQRTMLRKLKEAGVEAIVLASAPEDAITILNDMEAMNLYWPVVVGEQSTLLPFTKGADDVAANLMMIREQQPTLANSPVYAGLPGSMNEGAKLSLLHGYMLAEIAAQAALAGMTDLRGKTFETELGSVTFGQDGRATFAPFALYKWNGKEPVIMESK